MATYYNDVTIFKNKLPIASFAVPATNPDEANRIIINEFKAITVTEAGSQQREYALNNLVTMARNYHQIINYRTYPYRIDHKLIIDK